MERELMSVLADNDGIDHIIGTLRKILDDLDGIDEYMRGYFDCLPDFDDEGIMDRFRMAKDARRSLAFSDNPFDGDGKVVNPHYRKWDLIVEDLEYEVDNIKHYIRLREERGKDAIDLYDGLARKNAELAKAYIMQKEKYGE